MHATAGRKRPARRTEITAASIRHRVESLARNLWWGWNAEAQRLFAGLDPLAWEAAGHNPIRTLSLLTPERWQTLLAEPEFLAQLETCESRLADYLAARPWFARTSGVRQRRMLVAYFSAEFAIHECLQQYAGGLGVLAGDHLKSASDLGVPLVGVGLLYRSGYYVQRLRADGTTNPVYPTYDFAHLPISDTGVKIAVPLADQRVLVRVWKTTVGRIALYQLDTDLRDNPPALRKITQRLYGGDSDTRIAQEIVLGVGGAMALEALGLWPTVFHLNEGHAAFCVLERLRRLRVARMPVGKATENIRGSTVFTTHTPVPAGHDRFSAEMMERYLGGLRRQLGMSPPEFLGLGRENTADAAEPFCMTVLALRLAKFVNGVSALHGAVSREMWMKVYGAKSAERVPIGHITNGVHAQTWLAPEMTPLYEHYLKPNWVDPAPKDNCWRRAERIEPHDLWAMRSILRARLINFIRRRLVEQIDRRSGPVDELWAAHSMFDEHLLTIGFARRFATYKRAPLIFHDVRRLARILDHGERPVQIVFAGKAHPRDAAGQAFAQEVYRMAAGEGFLGRIVLLENYDMEAGRILTSGCDVWLNNPLRPQEASGTSGMKPPLHGGLNCSILDGWWPESFNRRNGWAIGDGRAITDPRKQDAYDARCIYDLLEKEIAPAFYDRGRDGLPRRWVKLMIESMKTVCATFNTHRMVGEYVKKYYLKAHG
ncbi:Carbohydrate phosphorylase [Phycisphaerae bacterium RAS1]|nr:Carbohydrate phosphorylase [Phycisphaerae bacterium RAS1]